MFHNTLLLKDTPDIMSQYREGKIHMTNFVFISPNFPTNYWMFCRELKNNGINVLGIGDQPYNELSQQLKDSLNE